MEDHQGAFCVLSTKGFYGLDTGYCTVASWPLLSKPSGVGCRALGLELVGLSGIESFVWCWFWTDFGKQLPVNQVKDLEDRVPKLKPYNPHSLNTTSPTLNSQSFNPRPLKRDSLDLKSNGRVRVLGVGV